MEHLSNDHENHPNQQENSNKALNESWYPDLSLLETEIATSSELPNGWKAIVEQILAPEERNKPKRAGL